MEMGALIFFPKNNQIRNGNNIYKLFKLFKIVLFLWFYYLNYELIKKHIRYLFNDQTLNNNINFEKITYINIDNEFVLFEENIDYSNYSTDIKVLALYLPQYHFIKENNIWWGDNFTEWTNVKKAKPYYEGHHQPRKPGDEKGYLGYYLLTDSYPIKKQVELAKSHGIYGFAIYYYWFSGKKLLEKPIDIYLQNKDIDFPFLLIWANENWSRNWNGGNNKILIKQKYKLNDPVLFIKDIKIYMKDDRYIKINGKSVIGIYEPLKIPHLKETVSIWRKEAKINGIGELFIIISLNNHKISVFKKFSFLDAAYDFPPRNIFKYFKYNDYNYSFLIEKNKHFINLTNDFPVFRGSMLEWDNSPRRGKAGIVFKEYSPEKFYLLNKIIIQYTKTHYNEYNRFIFINAWNEWGEGSYLEPDDKYGYSSINSLSKALFNLPYILNNVKYLNSTKSSKIAVQIILFCDYMINEIMRKICNIPIKYDLFIFTNSSEMMELIENNIKEYLNCHKYYIMIIDNDLKNKRNIYKNFNIIAKKYKYICNIKNIINNIYFNKNHEYLRYNLFNNLIGNNNTILDILSNFETHKELGFVFSETNIFSEKLTSDNKIFINNILDIIFPGKNYKIGKQYKFILGNIFWAKIESIYQIFNVKLYKILLTIRNKELIIKNIDIFFIFLLYLVKINGFYYKKIF